jgi:hypothetical protein
VRLLLILLTVSAASWAEGPGSRIRAGSPPTPPPSSDRSLERCQALGGEARERCMKEVRKKTSADERTRGPTSVGGGK